MARPQYNHQHQRERTEWDHHLEANGPQPCRRCRRLVYCDRLAHLNPDGKPFDLGHPELWQAGKEPEHQSCNRSAGARSKHEPPASEEWW